MRKCNKQLIRQVMYRAAVLGVLPSLLGAFQVVSAQPILVPNIQSSVLGPSSSIATQLGQRPNNQPPGWGDAVPIVPLNSIPLFQQSVCPPSPDGPPPTELGGEAGCQMGFNLIPKSDSTTGVSLVQQQAGTMGSANPGSAGIGAGGPLGAGNAPRIGETGNLGTGAGSPATAPFGSDVGASGAFGEQSLPGQAGITTDDNLPGQSGITSGTTLPGTSTGIGSNDLSGQPGIVTDDRSDRNEFSSSDELPGQAGITTEGSEGNIRNDQAGVATPFDPMNSGPVDQFDTQR